MAKNSTSILGSLKLVAFQKPVTTSTDPVVNRRVAMVAKLQDQLKLLQDPNFKKVLRHRQKGDDGKTMWTETEHKLKPWWQQQAEGVVFFVKSGFKEVELAKGVTGIQVKSMAELPETINKVIAAVNAGELDAQLKAAADASPIKKAREKAKKS